MALHSKEWIPRPVLVRRARDVLCIFFQVSCLAVFPLSVDHVIAEEIPSNKKTSHYFLFYCLSNERIGAGEEIRTPDQRLGKPMRYHCATPARGRRREFILGKAPNASQGNSIESVWVVLKQPCLASIIGAA